MTKLFDVLGPRFAVRPGGYTRIVKLAKPRLGENADRAIFEFVERTGVEGEGYVPPVKVEEPETPLADAPDDEDGVEKSAGEEGEEE